MKLAIIGFGGMAHHHYTQIVKRLNESNYPNKIEFTGVYDTDVAKKKEAETLGMKAYSSADELFADKSVDAVLVATPNDSHKDYVVRAAKAGKNIICEKPIACSYAEAVEMFDACEKAGVVFEVHQNRRWDDDFTTVKNIYDSGIIGDVYTVESRVMGSNGIPGAWRKVFRQGGGMMLDWGVHLIDQMLIMVKSKVTSVFCEYSYIAGEEVEDGFNVEVKFENGVLYRIVVDTNTFINLPRWQVYGINGTACVSDWDLNGKIVQVKERVDASLKGIKAGNGFTKTMADRSKSTINELPLEIVRADNNEFYRNFVECTLKKQKPIVKREEVLRVFDLMETAFKSAKENIVIKKII